MAALANELKQRPHAGLLRARRGRARGEADDRARGVHRGAWLSDGAGRLGGRGSARSREGASAPSLRAACRRDGGGRRGPGDAALVAGATGAVGYLVLRPVAGRPWEPVDHGGRDVLAVPGPWYCDTTGEPRTSRLVRGRLGRRRSRRSRASARRPVAARRAPSPPRRSTLAVDPSRPGGPPRAGLAHGRLRARLAADVRRGRRAAASSARTSTRRCGSRARSWAPTGSARTRSCRTSSASTASGRRAGLRLLAASIRLYERLLETRPAPGRRALVHAARPRARPRARRCSSTAASSRRRTTGSAGPS